MKRHRVVYDPYSSPDDSASGEDKEAREAIKHIAESEGLRAQNLIQVLSENNPILRAWKGGADTSADTMDRREIYYQTRESELARDYKDVYESVTDSNFGIIAKGGSWTWDNGLVAYGSPVSFKMHNHPKIRNHPNNPYSGDLNYGNTEMALLITQDMGVVEGLESDFFDQYVKMVNQGSEEFTRLYTFNYFDEWSLANFGNPGVKYYRNPYNAGIFSNAKAIWKDYTWEGETEPRKTPTWYITFPVRLASEDGRIEYYRNVQYTCDPITFDITHYSAGPDSTGPFLDNIIPEDESFRELVFYPGYKYSSLEIGGTPYEQIYQSVLAGDYMRESFAHSVASYVHSRHSPNLDIFRKDNHYRLGQFESESPFTVVIEAPSAEEQDNLQPTIVMVQDGGHELVPYAILPLAIRVYPEVEFTERDSGLPVKVPLDEYSDYLYSIFFPQTQSLPSQGNNNWLRELHIMKELLMPFGFYNLQIENIQVSYDKFRPTEGFVTDIKYVYKTKDIVERIDDIESNIATLEANIEIMAEEIRMIKTQIDKKKAEETVNSIGDTFVDFMAGFLPPAASSIFKYGAKGLVFGLKSIIQGVEAPVGVEEQGGLYTLFWKTKTLVEGVVSGSIFSANSEAIGRYVSNVLVEAMTASGILDMYPVISSVGGAIMDIALNEALGMDLGRFARTITRIVKAIRGQNLKMEVSEFMPYASYYLSPLDILGPVGRKFYEAIQDIGIDPALYDELTVIPAHGYVTVHFPSVGEDDIDGYAEIRSTEFIVSVGDFVGNGLEMMKTLLGINNENPSLFGYFKYERVYDKESDNWEIEDPEDAEKYHNFIRGGTPETPEEERVTPGDRFFLVNNYRITVEPDMFEAFCTMFQKYAPGYNLIKHNCQVMSQQIIAMSSGTYRPSWWDKTKDAEVLEWIFTNGEGRDWESEYRNAAAMQAMEDAVINLD